MRPAPQSCMLKTPRRVRAMTKKSMPISRSARSAARLQLVLDKRQGRTSDATVVRIAEAKPRAKNHEPARAEPT